MARRKSQTPILNPNDILKEVEDLTPKRPRTPKRTILPTGGDELKELQLRATKLSSGKAKVTVQLRIPIAVYRAAVEMAEATGSESVPQTLVECAADGLSRWKELPSFHRGALVPGTLTRAGLFGSDPLSRTMESTPARAVAAKRFEDRLEESDLTDMQLQESLRIQRSVGDLAIPEPGRAPLPSMDWELPDGDSMEPAKDNMELEGGEG
jgi:hypothetical protein